jgi:hypothetical protein
MCSCNDPEENSLRPEYEYEPDGRIKRTLWFNEKGDQECQVSYSYLPTGHVETSLWEDGTKDVRHFNLLKQQVLKEDYDADGKLRQFVVFDFDPNGNLQFTKIYVIIPLEQVMVDG